MNIRKISIMAAAFLSFPISGIAGTITVFEQDFESGINTNPMSGPTESIFADHNTRNVNCGATNCPFSATPNNTPNWGIHRAGTNPYAGSDAISNNATQQQIARKVNPNMVDDDNMVMGHIFANYNGYEDNYYQIEGIDLGSNPLSAQLMFDYDSWIESDVDGFAVSIRQTGSGANGWSLLNPNASSEMTYSNLGEMPNGDDLNDLSGYNPSTDDCGIGGSPLGGNNTCGFDGFEANMEMAGIAMFDLINVSGQIDLRFSFASDSSPEGGCGGYVSGNSSCSSGEGINIDNIKITREMPGTGIPEPSSIGLMMLGATALYRRRKSAQS